MLTSITDAEQITDLFCDVDAAVASSVSVDDRAERTTLYYRLTYSLVLAYKCQQGTAPLYLREYCQPLSSVVSRQRRSAHSGRLTVPRTRTNYGDRSFAVQGPQTWNSLPADLRAPDISVETFRHKLTTFLFAV